VILLGSVIFAGLGSLYPIVRGVRLSPVDAMRSA
jgi:ABC-type lipoprotein release transport system permease subunit